MYSHSDRLKAVETYIQCGKSAAVTVRIIGYPSKGQLKRWYESYVDSNQILPRKKRKPKYNAAERRLAIEHYFRTGKCIARKLRELGYPSQQWLRALKGDLPGATTNLSKLALEPARVVVIQPNTGSPLLPLSLLARHLNGFSTGVITGIFTSGGSN